MKSPSDIAPRYLSGFGNHFASEALPGALPQGRNSPQRCAYGLYAEQFSGTAFTAPRHANRRSWLYRIRPAAVHGKFRKVSPGRISNRFAVDPSPNRLRWSAPALPRAPTDFLAGLATLGGNGSPDAHTGCAIYWYVANRSMNGRFFYDADGELLIVPQLGRLRLVTELGVLEVAPLEIAVIPRGLRFRVELLERGARGYVCENFGAPLRLPDLGPIGSNGLANPRDFLTPVAAFEDRTGRFELLAKFAGDCGLPRSAIRRSTWWPGMATTSPTSTTCADSTRWARSVTTIRIRRFSWCCSRSAIPRAWTTLTS